MTEMFVQTEANVMLFYTNVMLMMQMQSKCLFKRNEIMQMLNNFHHVLSLVKIKLINWLIDRLIGRPIYWSIDWLSRWVSDNEKPVWHSFVALFSSWVDDGFVFHKICSSLWISVEQICQNKVYAQG